MANQIQQRGIDAVNVRDLGLLGDTDIHHLKRASEMGRVLCTYDTDFLQLAAEGIEHSGIVFGWANRTTIGDWIKGLELLCGVYSPEDIQNHVEYLP